MKKRIKIGIVGCGAIGLYVAKAIETQLKAKAVLFAISDIDQIKIDNFLSKIKSAPQICSLKELIKKCDFIVEAASASVSADIAKKSLSAGKDVLIMSVGGLLKEPSILKLAEKYNARLYIPSGALAGLDGLKGASIAGINKVTLTTRKSPKALEGAPFLTENNIDILNIKEEKIIFEGTAQEAVKGFPKNINVAATLNLICNVGARCTVPLHIRIVAVPGLKTNVHEVEVEGSFGRLLAKTENVASPDNPKTSYLAALSAIAALKGALDNVRIGT